MKFKKIAALGMAALMAVSASSVVYADLPEGYEIREQADHKYVAIHIDRPFDNPFVTIPGAYHTLNDYMRTNGLTHSESDVIPGFETDGEGMDVYIACE